MKIDISPIVKAHLDTLRDNRFGQQRSTEDMLIFFALPFLVGAVPPFFKFGFRVDAVNGCLTAFSILTGLLLNLLVLLFSLATAPAPPEVDRRKRRRLLTEVFSSVCYCLVVAILVILVAVVALSYMRSTAGARTGILSTFLLGFLTTNFIFTILMVVKRIFVIFQTEMAERRESLAA